MTEIVYWLVGMVGLKKVCIKRIILCQNCKHYKDNNPVIKADDNLFLCTGHGKSGFCSEGEEYDRK